MQRGRAADHRKKRPLDRVSNACKRCRRQKIKCSGTQPCRSCHRRGSACEFESDEKKVLVPESYLNDLKARLQKFEQDGLRSEPLPQSDQNLDTQPLSATTIPQSGILENEDEILNAIGYQLDVETSLHDPDENGPRSPADVAPNPLAPDKPAYVVNSSGKLVYLGHSSTWAFSRQVLQMTRQHFQTPSPFLHGEAEAYDLRPDDSLSIDLSGLPSLEMAILLMSTVKYRLQPFFYLFDEDDFVTYLHTLYKNPLKHAQADRLRYVRFLVITALGKSLSTTPQAGLNLFSRALQLLPDISYLCMEPIVAIEVTCSIAVYLKSIDHRNAAFALIGQAIRLAQIHGIHTDQQITEMGEITVRRFRKLWWTLYSLDRRFSAMIGLAHALDDDDITSHPPSTSEFEEPFVLSVKLSQQIGRAVNTVYGFNGRLNRALLPTAQVVIRGLAGLADEIAAFSDSCFGEMSRTAAHLNLAYHQCIILTTRPFLFYILQRRLETNLCANTFALSASTKGLLQICIESAVQIVSTLTQLQHHDLLDSFLPFDLDGVFSAAFVLLMAARIHPKLHTDHGWIDSVYRILDHMSSKGNLLAALRRSEIEELQETLGKQRQNDISHQNDHAELETTQPETDAPSVPSLGDPFFDVWNLNDVSGSGPGPGFSGTQLMSLADELGNEDWGGLWIGEYT